MRVGTEAFSLFDLERAMPRPEEATELVSLMRWRFSSAEVLGREAWKRPDRAAFVDGILEVEVKEADGCGRGLRKTSL